jgi:nucleoid DNA-binding protein
MARPKGKHLRTVADEVSRDLGLPLEVGRRFLDGVLDKLTLAILGDGRIEIRGLGSFTVHRRPERRTRHPKTGAPIVIPARRAVRYRSSSLLRRRLNPPQEGSGSTSPAT